MTRPTIMLLFLFFPYARAYGEPWLCSIDSRSTITDRPTVYAGKNCEPLDLRRSAYNKIPNEIFDRLGPVQFPIATEQTQFSHSDEDTPATSKSSTERHEKRHRKHQ